MTTLKHVGADYRIKRPTYMEKLYGSTLVIMVDYENGVTIEKNRHGNCGKPSTKELVDILCHILASHVHDGRMMLFQEGLKTYLKKAVNKVLKKGMI